MVCIHGAVEDLQEEQICVKQIECSQKIEVNYGCEGHIVKY